MSIISKPGRGSDAAVALLYLLVGIACSAESHGSEPSCDDDGGTMTITATVDQIPLGAYGLVLKIGQSNAAHPASSHDLPSGREGLAAANPLVQRAQRAYSDEADFTPTDRAIEDILAAGSNMGFELSLAEGLGANHLILEYWVSGSTMQHWDTVDRWSDLYAWADAQIALYPHDVYLKAIVFCQGESETGATIAAWKGRVQAQLAIMRTHFGRERAPLYVVETSETAEPVPGGNGIQVKQAELVDEDNHAVLIDTAAYPGDPLHWRAPEMVYIGDDLATAMLAPP